MNTNNSTNLHMTADVWNALQDMMNVGQLEYFIENLDYLQRCFLSDEFVNNSIDNFGGSDKVLLLLNTFSRMRDLFVTINDALESKGGAA